MSLLFANAAFTSVGNAGGLLPSSVAGSLYLSLHTADPGEAGDQTTNEVSYTSYARVAVARNGSAWTVSGNAATLAANTDFPAVLAVVEEAELEISRQAAPGLPARVVQAVALLSHLLEPVVVERVRLAFPQRSATRGQAVLEVMVCRAASPVQPFTTAEAAQAAPSSSTPVPTPLAGLAVAVAAGPTPVAPDRMARMGSAAAVVVLLAAAC